MTIQASTQDLEQGFEITLRVRTIDNSERAGAERGVHLALIVASRPIALDHNSRRMIGLTSEQLEHADAGLLISARDRVQRQRQIHDSDVHRGRADHTLRGTRGVGDQRADPKRREQCRQTIHPGIGLPPGSREQEIQTPRGGISGGMGLLDHHV